MGRLKKYSLLNYLLILSIIAIGGCETQKEAPATTPPNIVLILIDDLGWGDLGFMGSTYYETPNIDALAEAGMIFTQAYSNAPNCAPTRAALISGQYAPRHGVYTVGTSERGESRYRQLIPTENTTELTPDVITMAEALHAAGYATGHFGKWHLGNGVHLPENQGFDVSIPAWWARKRSHFFPEDLNPEPDSPGALPGDYMSDYLTDRALEFLEEKKDEPFFLYLPHYGVHTPIEGKSEKAARYEQKPGNDEHNNPIYAAMIESVDESVGRVMQKLKELDIAENTLVIFFSDNGGYGPATDMSPLRGAKGMLYEGGIRVPMIATWPRGIEAEQTNDTPVLGIDFYPTFLELAGTESPINYTLDGVSLAPLFQGDNEIERDALFWHFPAYLEAYRDMTVPWRTTPAGAIRQGNYKLIEFFGEQRHELYNLAEDIGETQNLAEQLPEKTDSLWQKLKTWRSEVSAPVPQTPNPEFDETAYFEQLQDAN